VFYIPLKGGTYRRSWRSVVCVAGVKDELAAEARELSMLVVEVSNALVDLRMLAIQDILQLLKMAQEVLPAAGLILQCLREQRASGADP
jgi:hypothetical protein